MHSHQLTTGRTFGVRLDPGESFFPSLEEFCHGNEIRCGYIPMFLAAFAEADVVGTCDKLDDPAAPVWSKVHLTNAEALGCGTIAYDQQAGRISPHVHTTLGLKERSATGYTSHLLEARIQFLAEIIVVEVTAPAMTRHPDPGMYDVPLLAFGDGTSTWRTLSSFSLEAACTLRNVAPGGNIAVSRGPRPIVVTFPSAGDRQFCPRASEEPSTPEDQRPHELRLPADSGRDAGAP